MIRPDKRRGGSRKDTRREEKRRDKKIKDKHNRRQPPRIDDIIMEKGREERRR